MRTLDLVLWACLSLGACSRIETGETTDEPPSSSTATTTATSSETTSATLCTPLQPCADAAGEAAQLDACQVQIAGSGRVLACGLDEPTRAGCTDLAALAPFTCADGTTVRLVCCY